MGKKLILNNYLLFGLSFLLPCRCRSFSVEDGHASGQSQPQSPVGQMSLGDLSEASMPAPTDSLLASAGPIKKKRYCINLCVVIFLLRLYLWVDTNIQMCMSEYVL